MMKSDVTGNLVFVFFAVCVIVLVLIVVFG